MLESTPSPVTTGLILVCEKCGKKLAEAESLPANPALNLQKLLKATIKERYGKGKARALITSCMDICPAGRISVAVALQQALPVYFTIENGETSSMAEAVLRLLKL